MALDLYRKCPDEKREDGAAASPSVSMSDIVNSEYPWDPWEILGERSFDEPRPVPESEAGSPVQEFFRDAVVLLTGGTGFMGKVLLEKLLRTCPHVRRVYLLIRPKKGKRVEQRLDEIFTNRFFKRLKHEKPNYYTKVCAVVGDCSLPGLGLSENSRNTLINEVNIIFHGAATVRFNEHIRVAMSINVSGVREVLALARQVTNLKAIAHISTAYSNCNRLHVEEKFYPPSADYEEVLKLIATKDDRTLEEMTSEIIGDLPNTYSFTKSLAEDVIRREANGLPILVFRPTIVISTYREPVRGWIDNVYGPIGAMVGFGTGVLHAYFIDIDIVPDFIPVDIAVNSLICATKETATKKTRGDVPIYASSSSGRNPVKWPEFIEMNTRLGIPWPTIRAIWYVSVWVTKNPYVYALMNFFLHIVPGFILDTLAVLSGRKPMLLNIYKKIGQARDTLTYFSMRQWTFVDDNTQALWDTLDGRDKELFNFDVKQISWERFAEANLLGMRVYLVNDDIHTLPAARKRWKRLYMAHKTLTSFLIAIPVYCTWKIINVLLLNDSFA